MALLRVEVYKFSSASTAEAPGMLGEVDRARRSATVTHSLSLPGLSIWSTIARQTSPLLGLVAD